jgi:Luciferase-like monooxygenase
MTKVGVVLPTFRETPAEALAVAGHCERLGIDGVFAYDHLWPMGNRNRPALAPFPVLAAIATAHPKLSIGTLVARIGLVADEVLIDQFVTLDHLAPGRVIAAIGTGDKLNREENEAYGIAFGSADERRESLSTVISRLTDRRIESWVGGLSAQTRQIARDHGCTLNLWGVDRAELTEEARRGPVTWAGIAPTDHDGLRNHFQGVNEAGASWAVYGFPVDLEVLASLRGSSQGL